MRISEVVLAIRSHPSFAKPLPRTSPLPPTFVRYIRRWIAGCITIGRGAQNNQRKKEKEAERRQTRVSLLHRKAQRAPCAGRARLSAFHCGSRQGDGWSPRLSVRPCFPGQSGAFGPQRPPQPGGGDLALCHGRYPRRNNPSAVSTSHAGRRAGRMIPEPPGSGSDETTARGHRNPAPASHSSVGWRPCTKSELRRLLFLVTRIVKICRE
jgi:hypothetical protein